MNKMFEDFVKQEVKKLHIAETLTSFLVKKKKRGTYQALEESKKNEEEIEEAIIDYINNWLISLFLDGKLKNDIIREIQISADLELARKGFTEVKLNKLKRVT